MTKTLVQDPNEGATAFALRCMTTQRDHWLEIAREKDSEIERLQKDNQLLRSGLDKATSKVVGMLEYKPMFEAAVRSIAEISAALGIPEEAASTANGNEEILAVLEELVHRVKTELPPHAHEPGVLLPGEDIAEALERQGDPLSLRAARHIRIKWNTEEGLRRQLLRTTEQLNASPSKSPVACGRCGVVLGHEVWCNGLSQKSGDVGSKSVCIDCGHSKSEAAAACENPSCVAYGRGRPIQHASDCAVHNAPALSVGPCDCGAEPHVHAWKFANINNIDYCKCGAQRPHQAGTR